MPVPTDLRFAVACVQTIAAAPLDEAMAGYKYLRVERHGAILVWLPRPGDTGLPDNIRATFPRAELQPPLVLPRRTLRPVTPETIHFAIVPPQPSAR